MLDRAAIASLIPHAGSMCLWHALWEADDQRVRLTTDSHRDPQNPLRREGRLAALHLLEYGAQAMAVHGGWMARSAGGGAQPGVLAAVRDLQLKVEWLENLPDLLTCEAQRLVANAGGWMYSFVLRCGEREIASGRASVIHLPT
ncbi:phosphotransferase [Sinimarinibacterium sp. CAU 1509]|uniref:phosphotransferase n=1 Tax=Sinimarinibacterium sp. CAU 1509 TaxID=2562283 RepID=UPI0010AC7FBB|nr:phosphotransferase [Sinimarinibacterium sp. CAU 1509]